MGKLKGLDAVFESTPKKTITITGIDGKKYVYVIPHRASVSYSQNSVDYTWKENGKHQKLCISLPGILMYEVESPE